MSKVYFRLRKYSRGSLVVYACDTVIFPVKSCAVLVGVPNDVVPVVGLNTTGVVFLNNAIPHFYWSPAGGSGISNDIEKCCVLDE